MSECCKRFDKTLYDDKVLTWNDMRFLKHEVRTFFYMPLNFGSVMKKLDTEARKYDTNFEHSIVLCDHFSKWKMDVYAHSNVEVPTIENIFFSGKFYSKVYNGSYSDTGKYSLDFEKSAKEKGFVLKKIYFWYTTCPKCAKKFGENYTVIIGEI